MDPAWESEFRARMHSFELRRQANRGEVSLSVKVRVRSGCFHREHSPHAYQIIDRSIASLPASPRSELEIVEHENGPELLVYLAAGFTLVKSVIDLIVVIMKARNEGVKRGDQPNEPVDLIIRRAGDGKRFVEETVLRIGHNDPVERTDIEARINASLARVAATEGVKTSNQGRRKRLASPKMASRTPKRNSK